MDIKAVPDTIALKSSISRDGVVRIPGSTSHRLFERGGDSGSIPFDPGANRAFARLKQSGVTCGAISASLAPHRILVAEAIKEP